MLPISWAATWFPTPSELCRDVERVDNGSLASYPLPVCQSALSMSPKCQVIASFINLSSGEGLSEVSVGFSTIHNVIMEASISLEKIYNTVF